MPQKNINSWLQQRRTKKLPNEKLFSNFLNISFWVCVDFPPKHYIIFVVFKQHT